MTLLSRKKRGGRAVEEDRRGTSEFETLVQEQNALLCNQMSAGEGQKGLLKLRAKKSGAKESLNQIVVAQFVVVGVRL